MEIKENYYLKIHRIEAVRKSLELTAKNGYNIYKSALYRLEGDCFDTREKGTQEIAVIIEQLYHERKLLEKYYKRASYKGYWDLSDINNPHYRLLGDGEEILKNMRQSIINCSLESDDTDINELIYDLCDREIQYYNEDKMKRDELPSYKRLLYR